MTQVMPLPRSGNEADSGGQLLDTEMGPYLSAAFGADSLTLAGVQDISNTIIQAQNSNPDPTNLDLRTKIKTLPVDQQVIVLPGSANRPYPSVAQGHEVSMSWEPNGTQLACSYTELPMLDNNGNPVDPDGKPLPKGGNPMPISGIQIWSFVNNKPTHQPLYACLGYSVEPKNIAWSPDGARLAFELWLLKGEGVRELAGIRVLEVVEAGKDANGAPRYQGYKNLPEDVPHLPLLVPASSEGKPQNPRWSPDGKRLVYEMLRPDGKRDLWTINSDGTNRINLTKGQGDNSEAAWAPTL